MTTAANHLGNWPSVAVRRKMRTEANGWVSGDPISPWVYSWKVDLAVANDVGAVFSVSARFRFFWGFFRWGGRVAFFRWTDRLRRSLWSFRVASPPGARPDLSHRNLRYRGALAPSAEAGTPDDTRSPLRCHDRPKACAQKSCALPNTFHVVARPADGGAQSTSLCFGWNVLLTSRLAEVATDAPVGPRRPKVLLPCRLNSSGGRLHWGWTHKQPLRA